MIDALVSAPLSGATLAGAAVAAMAGGAINSIAGGGTLVTFPSLVALGIPPLVANTTNTMALWPGALGSMWGYRSRLGGMRPWLIRFSVPSALGGLTGGWLLLTTGQDRFAAIVPYLVLAATVLFMLNGPVGRWLRTRPGGDQPADQTGILFFVTQFLVGVYGGYFGAGIGIMMLASLGFLGLRDLHRMIALRSLFGFCINLVASLWFVARGTIEWHSALVMTLGQVIGGYVGAALARRVSRELVRRLVVGIGIAIALSFFLTRR